MPSRRVFFALTGDVTTNSRAIRQLRILSALAREVLVLSFSTDRAPDVLPSNVQIIPLQRPEGAGPRFFWRVHQQIKKELSGAPADVFHASDIYVLPAMAAACSAQNARLVFDSRELYPHVASTAGKPWSRLFWHQICRRFLPDADLVFTVSASIARYLSDIYGIREPVVVPNYPESKPVPSSSWIRDNLAIPAGNTVFLHQGKMMRDRGGEELVLAFREIDRATLVFLGDGPLKSTLQTLVAEAKVTDRVHFLPAVPPDELLHVTASADVGITLLKDTCLNHRFALPNKLFEYIQAGIPVLASDLPEISAIVQGNEVGCVVKPDNHHDLVHAIRKMSLDRASRELWKLRSQKCGETFSWARVSYRFTEPYRALLE